MEGNFFGKEKRVITTFDLTSSSSFLNAHYSTTCKFSPNFLVSWQGQVSKRLIKSISNKGYYNDPHS